MLANRLHPFAGEVCDACRGPHLAGWQPRGAGIAGLGLPCLSGIGLGQSTRSGGVPTHLLRGVRLPQSSGPEGGGGYHRGFSAGPRYDGLPGGLLPGGLCHRRKALLQAIQPSAMAFAVALELPLESAVKINEGRRLHLRPSFAPGTKSSDYFSFAPSWKALATFSPSTRYALWMGSKVMGRSLSGSMVPFLSSTDSSALTLTISPTSRQLSGS